MIKDAQGHTLTGATATPLQFLSLMGIFANECRAFRQNIWGTWRWNPPRPPVTCRSRPSRRSRAVPAAASVRRLCVMRAVGSVLALIISTVLYINTIV